MTELTDPPETRVPAAESPADRCPYCERPFRTERRCALHLGEIHSEMLSAEERRQYEAADEEELDELFVLHMKVVVAIGAIYSVGVLLYMVVLSI